MVDDLNENGFEADVAPMFFMDTNPDGSSVFTVRNYKECYERNLKDIFEGDELRNSVDATMVETMKYVDDFFGNGGYEFLSVLEVKYNCASMCQVPLFWLTKDVSEGPPTKECVNSSIQSLSDEIGFAIAFVVTGVLLLFAVFGAIPLCSDYSEEYKMKQEEEKGQTEMRKAPEIYFTNEMI